MGREFIGNYKFIKRLGGGGQGDIYLAWDAGKSRYAAVKKFSKHLLDGIWEARILESLHHPGIPEFLGLYTKEDALCMAMEYIPGMSVKEYVRVHGKISERQTILWGLQILGILYYLHQRNPPVIHCDIKPSNLIITKGGSLSLIDYGTAVLGKEGHKRLGTCGYAAPEQMEGYADEQSDIYSFGMTLYHMATGHHPLQRPWKEDGKYGLSKRFAKILKRCLKRDKKDRYPSVAEVKKELERTLRKRARIRTGTAVLILFMTVGVYCIFQIRKEQTAYSYLLDKAEEERSKANSRFSAKAARYFELAIEEEPGQVTAYERLLTYYQSFGKEKEGLDILAEYVESKDFIPKGKEKLLYRIGLLYLQGKENGEGFSQDPVLAHRYLSMQEHPSETGRDYTELAGFLSGMDYKTDSLWRILERCRQKAENFRQIHFLYQIYRQKETELKKFHRFIEKQEELIERMESMSEEDYEKKTVLYEKEAFYERLIGIRGLKPWLEAADQYIDILKQEQDIERMKLKKARLLREHGRKEEAREEYREVIRQYSKSPEAYIAYGFYLVETGEKDMAQDMYRRAKKLSTRQDTELRKLGAVLGEGGN